MQHVEPMPPPDYPSWVDPRPWLLELSPQGQDPDNVARFLRYLQDDSPGSLERMAQKARRLTEQHFGRTIQLYAPLYITNFCPSGCAYCGYASDRRQTRRRLTPDKLDREMEALHALGLEDVLLLTGDRHSDADIDFLADAVARAARHFSHVGIEAFAMTTDEYRQLVTAGCANVTIYQETYDRALYRTVHRWGAKQDYDFRLQAPARALEAGVRSVGIGILLGLNDDPIRDSIALYRHARYLIRHYWQGGLLISFPRLRPAFGGCPPPHPVSDRQLVRLILAFRLSLPGVSLVLSTRESPVLRDGLAGIGINRMSVASRTTVGGYHEAAPGDYGQFAVHDQRDVETFCRMLRAKGLEPVFKNWDAAFQPANREEHPYDASPGRNVRRRVAQQVDNHDTPP